MGDKTSKAGKANAAAEDDDIVRLHSFSVALKKLISPERFQTLQDLVDDAATQGARVDLGGRPHQT
jgi:acyl-CoA reductase-like NAD-dependent aldehyde dehydrogenase